ncbi:glycerol-3-phosphate 1-O-acyltransferase PlsY [Candidatus Omnitrophota bacterium]
MIYTFIALLTAYLIGSIPTGYIFGKVLKGIDVRKHGSGNVGATNVFRSVGKTAGIVVLVLDFLKGFVAVVFLPRVLFRVFPGMTEGDVSLYIIMGAAAIAGHIWTCFLRFKGGKGVATTFGVMAGLFPIIFVGCLAVWVIFFSIWKYVSLASIAACISLPLLALATGEDIRIVLFTAVLCMVGVYVHRSNIKRLIQGTESKIVKVKKS